jgi:8-oxo-dGTP pyrophosphatase MutT (NUDIX family)
MIMKQKAMTILYRIAYLAQLLYWLIWRPVSMGVNVLIVQDGAVLLVRPVYRNNWTLPGGGLHRGETLAQAARREVREEVGFTLHELHLFGMYTNLTTTNSDHIAVFVSDAFTPPATPHHSYEIEEYRFFPFAELPANTGEGTRRRIAEYRRETAVDFREW